MHKPLNRGYSYQIANLCVSVVSVFSKEIISITTLNAEKQILKYLYMGY